MGPGGETPADVRSAEIVARRLLELRASAVCDLYEMPDSERHTWLKLFLDALTNALKKLWHPMVLILDEASDFCPEGKAGDSEASKAVMGFSRKGRKRGFCPVLATQSLATLDKKTSRHLHNRLIGPTFEDVDIERSIDLLSISARDKKEFSHDIRTMEPGSFYAFGRAISKVRVLFEVGPVSTTHPDIGRSKVALKPPPPPSKVKALLSKLADLPKEAKEKAQTVAAFRKEIRSLKAQLRAQPAAPTKRVVERVVDQAETEKTVQRAIKQNNHHWQGQIRKLVSYIAHLSTSVISISKEAAKAEALKMPVIDFAPSPKIPRGGAAVQPVSPSLAGGSSPPPRSLPTNDGNVKLKTGAFRMLQTLAQWHPDPLTRDQLGALAGFAPSGGTFAEYLGSIRKPEFIQQRGEQIEIREEGIAYAGKVSPRPDSSAELISLWKSKFKAGVGRMLDVLVENNPNWMSREELSERTYKGGTFSEYLGALRRACLIEEQGSQVRAAEVLFP